MMEIILGAGITGRLAKFLFPDALVLEKKHANQGRAMTRMWGTNYLWEPLPGIPCWCFQVITHVDGKKATMPAIRKYKTKVGKSHEINSDDWGLQFEEKTIGYDFKKVPEVPVEWGCCITGLDIEKKHVHTASGSYPYTRLISTLPLPVIGSLLGVSNTMHSCNFPHEPIYITVVKQRKRPKQLRADDEVYVNYCSDKRSEYRYCWRQGVRHTEYLVKPRDPCLTIWPGKIKHSRLARPLLYELANKDVFCFGRFATWNSNELVHETFKKLRAFRHGGKYEFSD
jgi:hypothetical protein